MRCASSAAACGSCMGSAPTPTRRLGLGRAPLGHPVVVDAARPHRELRVDDGTELQPEARVHHAEVDALAVEHLHPLVGVEPGRVQALVVAALPEVVVGLARVPEADETPVGRHAVLDQALVVAGGLVPPQPDPPVREVRPGGSSPRGRPARRRGRRRRRRRSRASGGGSGGDMGVRHGPRIPARALRSSALPGFSPWSALARPAAMRQSGGAALLRRLHGRCSPRLRRCGRAVGAALLRGAQGPSPPQATTGPAASTRPAGVVERDGDLDVVARRARRAPR